MKSFLLSNFVILLAISCLIDARPRRENSKKTKYVGCVYPYQFVNPYYHTLTSRSCANLLIDRSDIPQPNADEFRVGCDCIEGFAMNFQGLCINESECTIFEAFGALVDTGKIILPSSKEHEKLLQEHHDKEAPENQNENIQDNRNAEKSSHIIQKFFTENARIQNNKLDNGEMGENGEQGDEDDCPVECCHCCEEYVEEDENCICSDETENENTTEQQTASLIPTESSNINHSTASIVTPSDSSNKVQNIQKAELEKMNLHQSEKMNQLPSNPNAI
ncbi:uncharacterized protein LOC116344822 isoform X2 [Contarinia nasturtii]|uniref:uncharacterized protein LOC116344822 isoform X2 n=1 Tax=Contarinia nasturtii TaxID=265458 RepID=UPI0012D418C2|nr:uncharacterized protein LOC116344822 isoform X2 [Contarinia nasturtii]